MDMADILALIGLEWLYDVVEARWGRGAAALVTIGLAIVFIGALVWILAQVLNR